MQGIVYTSNTGFTESYAKLLGCRLSLPVYSLSEAEGRLKKGSEILYLGWLCASRVRGYGKAAKRYQIAAVCGVGLCDTGTMTEEVRKATSIPDKVPLFTLQGGFRRTKLRGINKLMIRMLETGLSGQKNRSEQEERMLQLIRKDSSFVREENLEAVIEWYKRTVKRG